LFRSATEQFRLLGGELFLGKDPLVAQVGEALDLVGHIPLVSGWGDGRLRLGLVLLGSGCLALSHVPADGGGRTGDYRGAADSPGEASCSAKRHNVLLQFGGRLVAGSEVD
jgi:hypothetical protein